MAFGLSFNKQKVLASAEKFVQQGKLQNAISEYQKVLKEDPKDLTVLNTIGDLCARVGQNDEAANYFRKAGDQYAQDGFTVKAIAVYKKLTRLNSGNIEVINKLGDLYSQQGLISDARAQYMQVADHLLKSGDNMQAAKVLQRILDLDPENTNTKSKLADLYLKLGKKDEARNIYYTAAESLYQRGAYDAAEEALDRILKMDPENSGALLLRGMIAADSGDSESAARFLSQVPDLDSRPDGLRALLRARLQSNSSEGLEGLATKLAAEHKDLSGIRDVAGWYAANNRIAEALRLYDVNADRLLSADRQLFQESLHPLIARIKEDPGSLSSMLRLLERAEDNSHIAEVMELQAHALAQKSQFQEARDLYHRLSELEPENALHQQNYKQMQSKLGEDPASRTLSPEEATQAFMVEALEEAAPAVQQTYDPTVEKAIEAALTDAELFVSYNVPHKAIPPLEAVLPMAPRDVTVNQRLATLYARGGRFADAARTCQILSEIYRERGHEKEAQQYQEAAQSYSLRAPKIAVAAAAAKPAHVEAPAAAEPATPVEIDVPAEQGVPSVQEFSFDVPDHLAVGASSVDAEAPVHEVHLEAADTAPPVVEAPAQEQPVEQQVQEIDVSNEWEGMLTVEAEAAAIEVPAPASQPPQAELPVAQTHASAEPQGPNAAEKIQEIEFYIDQQMWELAKKAILDLTEIAPDAPEITKLIAAVNAGQSRAAAEAAASEKGSQTPAAAVHETAPPSLDRTPEPAPVAAEPALAQSAAAEVPATSEFAIAPVQAASAPKPAAAVEESSLADVLQPEQPVTHASAAAPATPTRTPAEPAKPAAQFEEKSALEDVLEISPKPAATKKPAKEKKQKKEKTTEDILSDFVGDLEKTDLADFVPHPKAEAPATNHAPKPATAPPAPVHAPAAPATSVAGVSASPGHAHAGTNGDMRDAESTSVLSSILSELQDETAEPLPTGEDPETHYNLGIAFKEMGLLDEAIGELQKVCHAVDRGTAFSQPIQAYTWLAQCLVDKGAPQAAVRWYQRALKLPALDDSSRCAIYYDLAAAFEASGDNKSALANFMEVYGSNIDFRDVASRIKALKS